MNGITKRLPDVARSVPAGLIDAGVASAATFLTGLAGVNLLGDVDRGVYAVFFSAFLVATVIPKFLAFKPAEVISVSLPVGERLSQVVQSLRLGTVPALVGLLPVLIAAIVTASTTTLQVTVALASTAAVASIASPAQDHVRQLLHIDRRSWSAAWVSTVQFATVLVGVGAMVAADVPPAWIPFGALAAANVISVSLGLYLSRAEWESRHASTALSFGELASSGRWLLGMALIPYASSFVGAMLIVALAGPEAMGFAEAARVAAQPILVFATGLSAVVGPIGIEAAVRRDLPRAQRAQHMYLGLTVLAGVLYLAVAGHVWPGNPMVYLVPTAYRLGGLVALTIVGNTITGAVAQYTNELMGGRKERQLTKISLVTSPFLLLGAATASFTGAFARPLGMIASASVRYGAYGVARNRMYREKPDSISAE